MKVLLCIIIIGLIVMPIEAVAQVTNPSTTPAVAVPVEQHNGGQLTISAAVVLIIDWLKKSKWAPWITQETARINRTVAVIASGLAAVGVHATFDRTAGTFILTGLTLTGVATMGVAWLKSYVFQQTIFNMSKQ